MKQLLKGVLGFTLFFLLVISAGAQMSVDVLKSDMEKGTKTLDLPVLEKTINDFEALLEKKFPHLVGEFRILEPPIQINYNSPMLSIKHPLRDELIERYDKSYRKLVKAGIYERLAKKHGINNVSYRPLD